MMEQKETNGRRWMETIRALLNIIGGISGLISIAVIVWEVWSSTNYVDWTHRITTEATNWLFTADQALEVFRIRATNPITGQVSGWSVK